MATIELTGFEMEALVSFVPLELAIKVSYDPAESRAEQVSDGDNRVWHSISLGAINTSRELNRSYSFRDRFGLALKDVTNDRLLPTTGGRSWKWLRERNARHPDPIEFEADGITYKVYYTVRGERAADEYHPDEPEIAADADVPRQVTEGDARTNLELDDGRVLEHNQLREGSLEVYLFRFAPNRSNLGRRHESYLHYRFMPLLTRFGYEATVYAIDDTPDDSTRYALSVSRAQSVVHYLTEQLGASDAPIHLSNVPAATTANSEYDAGVYVELHGRPLTDEDLYGQPAQLLIRLRTEDGDPITNGSIVIRETGQNVTNTSDWQIAGITSGEYTVEATVYSRTTSRVVNLLPGDNLILTIYLRGWLENILEVFWEAADDFDDRAHTTKVYFRNWHRRNDDTVWNYPLALLGAVAETFITLDQAIVDTLRFGQGAREGGAWGVAQDGLRLMTLGSVAGKMIGKASQVIVYKQAAGSSLKVCTLVSVSRALRATGNRLYISLPRVLRGTGTNLATVEAAGTSPGLIRRIVTQLKNMGLRPRYLSPQNIESLDALKAFARQNRGGAIVTHINNIETGMSHSVCAQWKRGTLFFEETDGTVYRGVDALLQHFGHETVLTTRVVTAAAPITGVPIQHVFIPNSLLIDAAAIADVGFLAQVAVALRRVSFIEEEASRAELRAGSDAGVSAPPSAGVPDAGVAE